MTEPQWGGSNGRRYHLLGGGFKYVLFSPLLGNMIQFGLIFFRLVETTNQVKKWVETPFWLMIRSSPKPELHGWNSESPTYITTGGNSRTSRLFPGFFVSSSRVKLMGPGCVFCCIKPRMWRMGRKNMETTMSPQKPIFLESFTVNHLVFRWPKPSKTCTFHGWKGAHGILHAA